MTNIFELNKKIAEPTDQSQLRKAYNDPGLIHFFKSNKISANKQSSAKRMNDETKSVNHTNMVNAARRVL